MILLAICLALAMGCMGMFYLLHSKPQVAPRPIATQVAVAPTPVAEPTPFDPLPVVKAHTGKGISNGAKAELLGTWGNTAPSWVPESPSMVKLNLKQGTKTLELVWKIENGEAKPANKLAEELESWVPSKSAAAPAFLASSEPVVEEAVTPVAPRPVERPAPRAPSVPSTEWRDDGDPTTITNADLPPAAFAPKKPKADKPEAAKKPATSASMGSAGNLRFKGVMEGAGGRKAILSQGGEYMEVKVGESVGSYRVESINGQEVVLDKGGTRVRVQADRESSPPARPEKPQPPPRPELPMRPEGLSAPPAMAPMNQDLEVPPIDEPVFDPGPFDTNGK